MASNFVHRSAVQSLSLVMSECSLSGRGQGHVSNFYIVDLENFATANRRYKGDIHNSTIVGFYRAMLCIRGTSHGPVSVYVCLSVTSRCSTKTAKRRITQTTPHDTTGTDAKDLREIRPGSPPTRAPNAGGVC